MLVFTDEEVRRTHILGLFLSEVQEPGMFCKKKETKFNIVTSVIKIKYCPSNLSYLKHIIINNNTLDSLAASMSFLFYRSKNPTRPNSGNYVEQGFIESDI